MVKYLSFGIFVLANCLLQACSQAAPDPNKFCFDCQSRRNHKDLYANPDECHTYFQCFYNEDGTAKGILRKCPPLTFWHDEILQCLPEGSTPCRDFCQNSNLNTGDCYADATSCSTYFVCDNTASVQFCCPQGTRFNATRCGCDTDETCVDICVQPTRPPTTKKTPISNGVSCVDSYGNTLRPTLDNPGQFLLVSPEDPTVVFITNCAPGTLFSLEACACDLFSDDYQPVSASTQCSLYLPFDDDVDDHSINRFSIFKYGDVVQNGTGIRGSGAAFFNGGYLEIPGLKTFSPGKAASFCFFYQCPNGTNCGQGGILSNRKSADPNAEFSFYYASLAGGNNANAGVSTKQSKAILNFLAEPWHRRSRYTQICVVYDGTTVSVIENTRQKSQVTIAQQSLSGDVTVGTCPFVVGTDHIFGDFIGYIDDVLVCERALTQFEVMSHFAGRISMQDAGLIPTEITFPSYDSVKPQPSPYGACGHNKYWNAGEPMTPSLAIHGGFNAKPDEFPWSVLLISPNSPNVCSGSVLSEGYVITEGWCCASWLNASDGGVSSVTLYYGVGETGYPDFFPPNTTIIPPPAHYALKTGVDALIPNPNLTNDVWSLYVQPYDFCLVKVKNPVKFNSWKIQPICLPKSCDDTCQAGDADLLSGFGVLSGGWNQWNFLAKRDQYNVFPVISDNECTAALQSYTSLTPADFSSLFCAGYVSNNTNVGSGMGDDGTSLACYKKGYFSLDGILSIQFVMTPFYPIVFAKVCVVLDWIRSYIG